MHLFRMIGSQSVVLAKSSSFLITESIGGFPPINLSLIFIVVWGVSMTFWLYRMNTALKYEGVFIIPFLRFYGCYFILSGGILFKESMDIHGIIMLYLCLVQLLYFMVFIN